MKLIIALLNVLIIFSNNYCMEEKPEESKKPRYDLLRKEFAMRQLPLECTDNLQGTEPGLMRLLKPGTLVYAPYNHEMKSDNCGFVYDIQQNDRPLNFCFHNPTSSLCVTDDSVITGHRNGDIFISSADSSKRGIQQMISLMRPIYSLAFDAKKKQLIATSCNRENSRICFLDLAKDEPGLLHEIKLDAPASLFVDEDERLLITSDCSRIENDPDNLKFYDLDNYECIGGMDRCAGAAVALNVPKKQVIVGRAERLIFIEYPDKKSNKKFVPLFINDPRVIFGAHPAEIKALAVIPEKQILIASDLAGNIKTWDLTTKSCLQSLNRITECYAVTSIVFDPLTEKLFTCGDTVKVWEIKKSTDEEVLCIRDVKCSAETLKNCSWLAWLGCLWQMQKEKTRAQNTLSAPIIQQLNTLYGTKIPVNDQK